MPKRERESETSNADPRPKIRVLNTRDVIPSQRTIGEATDAADPHAEIKAKVLRRAEIGRMARRLQTKLPGLMAIAEKQQEFVNKQQQMEKNAKQFGVDPKMINHDNFAESYQNDHSSAQVIGEFTALLHGDGTGNFSPHAEAAPLELPHSANLHPSDEISHVSEVPHTPERDALFDELIKMPEEPWSHSSTDSSHYVGEESSPLSYKAERAGRAETPATSVGTPDFHSEFEEQFAVTDKRPALPKDASLDADALARREVAEKERPLRAR